MMLSPHIEDRLLANRIAASRSELGSLRRMLIRLQRLPAPEPAAFIRLLNRPPGWIWEEDLQNWRQAAGEFSTAVSDTARSEERRVGKEWRSRSWRHDKREKMTI